MLPVAVASVSAGAASGTGRSAGDVGVWQGRVLLESAQMVAFIGHAVWNVRTYGDGKRIVTMPSDEYSVSSACYSKGPDFLMSCVELFLEGIPVVSGTATRTRPAMVFSSSSASFGPDEKSL